VRAGFCSEFEESTAKKSQWNVSMTDGALIYNGSRDNR